MGGRGTPQGLKSASTVASVFPASGRSGVLPENILLRPIAAADVGGNSPCPGEMSPIWPPTSYLDGVRVFTVDELGQDITAIEYWNAECVAGMCASQTALDALQPSLQAEAVCLSSAGAARGLASGDGHGSQNLSDHFTYRSWGSSRPTPSSNSPRPTASPRGLRTAQGTDHPWPHLPQHRGAAERRPRVRRTVQCPVDRGEERLPEPRSSSSGDGTPRCHSGPPHETTYVSKEPGAIQPDLHRCF